eukprot:gene14021-15480_t
MALPTFSRPKISKSLLPAKTAYFFFYFSYSSVTPFIPVFMTAYGLNAEQAGFIFGARLFAQFLSGPCWGALADKTKRYRLLLLLQIVISSILTFAAPWVPKALPQTASQVNSIAPTTLSGNLSAIATSMPPFTSKITEYNPEISTQPSTFSISNMTKKLGQSTKTFAAGTMHETKPHTFTYPAFTNTSSGGKSQDTQNNNQHNDKDKPETKNIFILMIIWFALIGAFDGGIPLLIDNSVMNTIAKLGKSDFGKQRLWGAVGYGLAAFASGVGIQLTGTDKPNYNTMFYIFLGSNFFLFISCLFLKMKPADCNLHAQGHERQNMGKRLLKEFKKFHVSFFFLTILIMGMANGLLYGFMFLYIEDLNGSNIIMGLSILVACSTEVMMFPVSSKVIKTMRGNLAAITLAFFFYVIRFAGFSVLHNAWFILLLQLLHSVCFALFWAAAVYHTASFAPEGMQATFLGILNGLFFGVAGGVSSVLGGMVYNHFGGRILWRGFATICAVWTVLLLMHMFERRRYRVNKDAKKNQDTELQKKEKNGETAEETLLPFADS